MGIFLESKGSDTESALQALDEFSLLNIIGRLKEILDKIRKEEKNENWHYREEVVWNLIYSLCRQYEDNKLIFQDNTHPFIYYRFLQLIFNWKEEIFRRNPPLFSQILVNQDYFDNIWNDIYSTGKYEMYRQISLYESRDKSLFDAKRLLYSLLIVSIKNRYSNKKARDQALKIIFDEFLETGLWPIGNDVNTDFVLDRGIIRPKTSRIISSSPTLSSVECLSDLLEYKELEEDQVLIKEIELNKEYKLKLKKTYEWIITRLRYESKPPLLARDDIKSYEGLILNVLDSKSDHYSEDLKLLIEIVKDLFIENPLMIKTIMGVVEDPGKKEAFFNDQLKKLINVIISIKIQLESGHMDPKLFSSKFQLLLKITNEISDPNDFSSLDKALLESTCKVKIGPLENLCMKYYEIIRNDLVNIIVRDLKKLPKELAEKQFKNMYLTRSMHSIIPIGWYPEYEGTHTSKSWMVGHTLIFLINYCELLSRSIKRIVSDDLNAKSYNDITKKWEALRDSYELKYFLNGLIDQEYPYKSAFIFGPPGTGKSTIAKAMAKELRYSYVEITPGQLLADGEQRIITTANSLFKRLKRMRKTVIFFDEVDQFVQLREKESESSSKWIVTSLLPEFQELHNVKDIKFILATNNINDVDHAMKRSGRIDFVLPMGPMSWKDRLMELNDRISDIIKNSKEEYKTKMSNLLNILNLNMHLGNMKKLNACEKFEERTEIEEQIINAILENKGFIKDYLTFSDYMLYTELSDMLDGFIEKIKRLKTNDEITRFIDEYKFYEDIDDAKLYINPQFCKFQNESLILKEKKYVRFPFRMNEHFENRYGKDIIINIISNNSFNPMLVTAHILKNPGDIITKLKTHLNEDEISGLNELAQQENIIQQKIMLASFLNNLILTKKELYKRFVKKNNELLDHICEIKSEKSDVDIIVLNRLALETICEGLINRDNWDMKIKYKYNI